MDEDQVESVPIEEDPLTMIYAWIRCLRHIADHDQNTELIFWC